MGGGVRGGAGAGQGAVSWSPRGGCAAACAPAFLSPGFRPGSWPDGSPPFPPCTLADPQAARLCRAGGQEEAHREGVLRGRGASRSQGARPLRPANESALPSRASRPKAGLPPPCGSRAAVSVRVCVGFLRPPPRKCWRARRRRMRKTLRTTARRATRTTSSSKSSWHVAGRPPKPPRPGQRGRALTPPRCALCAPCASATLLASLGKDCV